MLAGDGASRFSNIADPNFRPLENTTHAPVGESNAHVRYMAASETKRNPRGGWSNNPHIPAWDGRALRSVPYECRGLKPVVTKEPWTAGLDEAWKPPSPTGSPTKAPISLRGAEDAAGGSYATAGLKRLDDGLFDSVAAAFNRRKREDAEVCATSSPDLCLSTCLPRVDSTAFARHAPALLTRTCRTHLCARRRPKRPSASLGTTRHSATGRPLSRGLSASQMSHGRGTRSCWIVRSRRVDFVMSPFWMDAPTESARHGACHGDRCS